MPGLIRHRPVGGTAPARQGAWRDGRFPHDASHAHWPDGAERDERTATRPRLAAVRSRAGPNGSQSDGPGWRFPGHEAAPVVTHGTGDGNRDRRFAPEAPRVPAVIPDSRDGAPRTRPRRPPCRTRWHVGIPDRVDQPVSSTRQPFDAPDRGLDGDTGRSSGPPGAAVHPSPTGSGVHGDG